MCPDRWVPIPEEVRDIYALWRPTPLLRAVRFEKALQTPAHIYYKYEGASPAGSHKPNTAVAQAYFNKVAGTKRLATETGAGQWGSSLALACKLFGLECNVYMVKVSYEQKPYRRMLMHTWGATVHPSPSDQTEYGRKVLARGSELSRQPRHRHQRSHRRHHQTSEHEILTGQRVESRLPAPDRHRPGIHQADGNGRRGTGCQLSAAAAAGSNFAGIAFPFIHKKITEKKKYRIVGVEPSACPSLTKGDLRYDFGDTAEMTPLLMMYTLGHKFMPPPIHAGGLRYHGMAPMVSHALKLGLIEAEAYHQTKVFEAGTLFARS